MTTSGVNTFTVSRNDIIEMAMQNIGKLAEEETPSAKDITDCSRFLNALVKQWQGKADFAPGLKTWTRRHGHLFLHSTTGVYTLGPSGLGWTLSYVTTTASAAAAAGQPVVNVVSATGMAANDYFGVQDATGDLVWYRVLTAVGTVVTLSTNLSAAVASGAVVYDYSTPANQPIELETAFLRDSQGNDSPIKIYASVQEYDALPSKVSPTNISDPIAVYYEFQLNNSLLYTDCAGAQDLTKHLCFTFMEAEQDFVNPLDTPEYPQEWYLALALNLSQAIAPMYQATWSPLQDANAKMALAIAQKKEPENIVAYFQCGVEV